MASSIETTSTTTTLKNNGNTYATVDTNDDVTITNDLAVSGTLNTTGVFVHNDAGAAVDFRVEGDTKPFLLFASGTEDKVGINTAGVIAQLTVEKTDSEGNIAISSTQASDNGDLGEFQFWNRTNAGSGSGTSFVNDVAAIKGQMEGTGNNSGGSLHFYTKPDGETKTEKMTIDGAGKVGIGTTTPTVQLHVKGTAAANNAELRLEEVNGDVAQLISIGDEFRIGTVAANPMAFRTSNVERMRIASNGTVTLGTPLPVASGGTGVTSSTGSGSTVLSASPTLTGTLNTAAITASGNILQSKAGNTELMSLNTTGTVKGGIQCLSNQSVRLGSTTNYPTEIVVNNAAKLTVGTNGVVTLAEPLPAASGGTGNTSGGGKVLQVLQAVKSDAFSTTSTSLVDVSGLSVTITPTSTSSKILVTVDLFISSSHFVSHAQLLRGSTQLYKGDAAGNRSRDTITFSQNDSGDGIMQRSSATYLDSPSTTSATTYKVQASQRRDGGHTCYINRTEQDRNNVAYDPRGASSITVMEIGA